MSFQFQFNKVRYKLWTANPLQRTTSLRESEIAMDRRNPIMVRQKTRKNEARKNIKVNNVAYLTQKLSHITKHTKFLTDRDAS